MHLCSQSILPSFLSSVDRESETAGDYLENKFRLHSGDLLFYRVKLFHELYSL